MNKSFLAFFIILSFSFASFFTNEDPLINSNSVFPGISLSQNPASPAFEQTPRVTLGAGTYLERKDSYLSGNDYKVSYPDKNNYRYLIFQNQINTYWYSVGYQRFFDSQIYSYPNEHGFDFAWKSESTSETEVSTIGIGKQVQENAWLGLSFGKIRGVYAYKDKPDSIGKTYQGVYDFSWFQENNSYSLLLGGIFKFNDYFYLSLGSKVGSRSYFNGSSGLTASSPISTITEISLVEKISHKASCYFSGMFITPMSFTTDSTWSGNGDPDKNSQSSFYSAPPSRYSAGLEYIFEESYILKVSYSTNDQQHLSTVENFGISLKKSFNDQFQGIVGYSLLNDIYKGSNSTSVYKDTSLYFNLNYLFPNNLIEKVSPGEAVISAPEKVDVMPAVATSENIVTSTIIEAIPSVNTINNNY